MRPRLLLTINCKFPVDFFSRGLHTRTAVARLPLRQLGFLVELATTDLNHSYCMPLNAFSLATQLKSTWLCALSKIFHIKGSNVDFISEMCERYCFETEVANRQDRFSRKLFNYFFTYYVFIYLLILLEYCTQGLRRLAQSESTTVKQYFHYGCAARCER